MSSLSFQIFSTNVLAKESPALRGLHICKPNGSQSSRIQNAVVRSHSHAHELFVFQPEQHRQPLPAFQQHRAFDRVALWTYRIPSISRFEHTFPAIFSIVVIPATNRALSRYRTDRVANPQCTCSVLLHVCHRGGECSCDIALLNLG